MLLDNIFEYIDNTSSLEIKGDIPEKDRCMIIIMLARHHLSERYRYQEYVLRKGKYMKKDAYVVSRIDKGIMFRIDVNSKNVYWKNGKVPRVNLIDDDYTFSNDKLAFADDGIFKGKPIDDEVRLWDHWGLWVSPREKTPSDEIDNEIDKDLVRRMEETDIDQTLKTAYINIYKKSGVIVEPMKMALGISIFTKKNEFPEMIYFDTPENGCVYEDQGPRSTMEDSHVSVRISDDILMYGVFDGHGGDRVSKLLTTKLPEKMYDALSYVDLDNEEKVVKSIKSAFLSVDDDIYHEFDGDDGSTAIVALIIKNKLYMINLGDSRGILVDTSGINQIPVVTKDHKPKNERERIEKAGGFVINGRVDGMLAVSRAFGDNSLKTTDGKYAGENAKVSPVPDVYIYDLESDKPYVLVLACDGLWDVMDTKEVASHIHYGMTCEWLVKKALSLNTTDNVTVMIVNLPALN